jgi:hypothetical protein
VLESETSFPFIHCWDIIDLEDGKINLSFPCNLGTSARDREHSAIFGPLAALDEINGINTELSITLLKLVVDAPHVTWDVLANMTEVASEDLSSLSVLEMYNNFIDLQDPMHGAKMSECCPAITSIILPVSIHGFWMFLELVHSGTPLAHPSN